MEASDGPTFPPRPPRINPGPAPRRAGTAARRGCSRAPRCPRRRSPAAARHARSGTASRG
ncbi:MAG: hypothetical protein EP329_10035 [Deltaproteobacteria bacterium]|nr:MAG: hypothetical protein EP329_10035 [Deltaproteobacteria bacterium]